MHSHALLPRPVIRGPPLHKSVRAAAAAEAAAAQRHHITAESAEHRQLRQQLGSVFPNALLLEDSRLPDLRSCRHYVNLTNGLDLAPILQQLGLPFSVVRIRSTSLEQQAFESLLLELDANLLLHLALGHSCVVWDTGCRNPKTGAPRALWYGLEFIRFALNRCWSNTRSSDSNSGSGDGRSSADGGGSSSDASSADGGGSSGGSHLLRAHIRGHDVSRDFEAACRSLSPSTKTRLRYYKRYASPHVQAEGVHLAGLFRRTDRDEDVAHFVALAQTCCGPDSSRGDSGVERAGWGEVGERASAWNVAAYTQLTQEGIGMFTRGLSHTEFRKLELSQQQH